LFGSIKDHVLIGGPNAVAGWGLLTLLVISGGISAGRLVAELYVFIPVLIATLCTGNGIYALNAVYDREADKINKPNRPLPAGRMTPKHALRYAQVLIAVGWFISLLMSIVLLDYLMVTLWTIFTLLGITYSVPPVKLKSRHICGNLCFAAFAMVAYLIGFLLSPLWAQSVIGIMEISMLALYAFLATIGFAGFITMKDFYDYEGDKANNDITLVVKAGRVKAAVISIALFSIPTLFFMSMTPPTSISDFIRGNWGFLVNFASFGMYIVLEYAVSGHYLSDAYSRVLYYYVILTAAYGFLSGPLGIDLAWELESAIFISAYIAVSFVAVYRSWRVGYDVLKTHIG